MLFSSRSRYLFSKLKSGLFKLKAAYFYLLHKYGFKFFLGLGSVLISFLVLVFLIVSRVYLHQVSTGSQASQADDIELVVDVASPDGMPIDEHAVPVNSPVQLKFRFTNHKPLTPGDRICLEFPINRSGVYDAERNIMWSPLGEGKSDQPRFIHLENSGGAQWSEKLATNGFLYNGYCIKLVGGMVPQNSAIVVRYDGKSQGLARPLRFRARYDRNQTDAHIFKARNVLLFKPDKLHTFNVKLPLDVVVGKPFSIELVALDRFGNRKTDFVDIVSLQANRLIRGLPSQVKFEPTDKGYKKLEGLVVNSPGFVNLVITARVADKVIQEASNFAYAHATPPSLYRLVGDTHFHTGYGMPNPFLKPTGEHQGNYSYGDEAYGHYAYNYAKTTSLLDFLVQSEHVGNGNDTGGYVIDDPLFPKGYSQVLSNKLADSQYQPGQFTTFYGYEWGGNYRKEDGGGHHIAVIYNNFTDILKASNSIISPGCSFFSGQVCVTPQPCDAQHNCAPNRPNLIQQLELRKAEFILIPHTMQGFKHNHAFDDLDKRHHHPMWDNYNAFHIPVGEIYSHHNDRSYKANINNAFGNENGYYQWGWFISHKIGVIGSSDNHYGTPGLNNISKDTEEDGGLAVVLARSNTREDIWAALMDRMTYGTSGPRIYLDFTADGLPMGSYYRTHQAPEFRLKVGGTEKLKKVQVLKLDSFDHIDESRWDKFKRDFTPSNNDKDQLVANDVDWNSNQIDETNTYVLGESLEEAEDHLSNKGEVNNLSDFINVILGQGEGGASVEDYEIQDDKHYQVIKEFGPADFANDGKTLEVSFADTNFSKNSMYYVRVIQAMDEHVEDAQGSEAAWSSPIWIDYGPPFLKANRKPYISHRQFDLPHQLNGQQQHFDYQIAIRDLDGVFAEAGLDQVELALSETKPDDQTLTSKIKITKGIQSFDYKVESDFSIEQLVRNERLPLQIANAGENFANGQSLVLFDSASGAPLAKLDPNNIEFNRVDAIPNYGDTFETLVLSFSLNATNQLTPELIGQKKLWLRVKDKFGSSYGWVYINHPKLNQQSAISPTLPVVTSGQSPTPSPSLSPSVTPVLTSTATPSPTINLRLNPEYYNVKLKAQLAPTNNGSYHYTVVKQVTSENNWLDDSNWYLNLVIKAKTSKDQYETVARCKQVDKQSCQVSNKMIKRLECQPQSSGADCKIQLGQADDGQHLLIFANAIYPKKNVSLIDYLYCSYVDGGTWKTGGKAIYPPGNCTNKTKWSLP